MGKKSNTTLPTLSADVENQSNDSKNGVVVVVVDDDDDDDVVGGLEIERVEKNCVLREAMVVVVDQDGDDRGKEEEFASSLRIVIV